MTQPMQTADFWDGTADQYIASAEPFTAQYCRDAVALAAIEPGMTLWMSRPVLARWRWPPRRLARW